MGSIDVQFGFCWAGLFIVWRWGGLIAIGFCYMVVLGLACYMPASSLLVFDLVFWLFLLLFFVACCYLSFLVRYLAFFAVSLRFFNTLEGSVSIIFVMTLVYLVGHVKSTIRAFGHFRFFVALECRLCFLGSFRRL